MSTTTYKTLSKSATVYDGEGYIQRQGVTVTDHGDIIGIGSTAHNRTDMTITGNTITSVHGWTVQL